MWVCDSFKIVCFLFRGKLINLIFIFFLLFYRKKINKVFKVFVRIIFISVEKNG